MVCTECNGSGQATYYVETIRDENTVTLRQTKGICRTCNGSGKKLLTNADGARAMSNEELYTLFRKIYNAGTVYGVSYMYGKQPNNFAWTMKWLKQLAEEQ